MNKEQQELLDEAHNNYLNKCLDKKWMKKNVFFDGSSNHHLYLQQEFINKCKTDTEFSERWGLKIDERELDMMERWKIADLTPNMEEFDFANYMCDKHNVPTNLIKVTYNDKTIESYE
jgi:hypothetical protein